MTRNTHTIILIFLVALTMSVKAQQASGNDTLRLPSGNGQWSVSATADNDSLLIGERTTLRIKVSGKELPALRFPSLDALSSDALEALSQTTDTQRTNGSTTIEQQVEMVAFAAGTHVLKNIVVVSAQGMYSPSDSIILTVSYPADADTSKCAVRSDVGIVGEPYTFWEIARWPLMAIALAAIVAAIVWIVRQRKANQPILPAARQKQVPPDQKALAELESLRRKELWQKGRLKRYYTEMTDTVRRFLKGMCGMPASEMTTRQTLKAFHQSSDWSEESEALLRQLLQKADMVKFAKSQPESHEHDLAMQNAVDFVRKVAEKHAMNNPTNENEKQ